MKIIKNGTLLLIIYKIIVLSKKYALSKRENPINILIIDCNCFASIIMLILNYNIRL